jgi:hypothetical protein
MKIRCVSCATCKHFLSKRHPKSYRHTDSLPKSSGSRSPALVFDFYLSWMSPCILGSSDGAIYLVKKPITVD